MYGCSVTMKLRRLGHVLTLKLCRELDMVAQYPKAETAASSSRVKTTDLVHAVVLARAFPPQLAPNLDNIIESRRRIGYSPEVLLGLKPEQLLAIRSRRRTSMAYDILEHAVKQGAEGVTCDESTIALKLKGNAASARFSELVKSGCLLPAKKRRVTSSGGLAQVYVADPDVNFISYLTHANTPRSKAKVLTPFEQRVLVAGTTFLRRWEKIPAKPQDHLTRLVNDLITAGRLRKGAE
jgi:hypothetical protein